MSLSLIYLIAFYLIYRVALVTLLPRLLLPLASRLPASIATPLDKHSFAGYNVPGGKGGLWAMWVKWDAVHYLRVARYGEAATDAIAGGLTDHGGEDGDEKFGGVINWKEDWPPDVIHDGYESDGCARKEYSETMGAFYRGYPELIRSLSRKLSGGGGGLADDDDGGAMSVPKHGTLPKHYIAGGLIVNNVSALLSLPLLHFLTSRTFPSDPRLAYYSSLIYIFNPAQIFFTNIGTEGLTFFLLLAFYIVHDYVHGSKRGENGDAVFVRLSALPFLLMFIYLSCSVRSTPCLVIFLYVLSCLASSLVSKKPSILGRPLAVAVSLAECAVALLPSLEHNIAQTIRLCSGTDNERLVMEGGGIEGVCQGVSAQVVKVLAGAASGGWISYCKAALQLPSIYRAIQRTYWDTGYFMSYYKLSNVPHFLIASPTFYLAGVGLAYWGKRMIDKVVKDGRGGGGVWVVQRVWDNLRLHVNENEDEKEGRRALLNDGSHLFCRGDMLKHVAVTLALMFVVGVFAHCQIITRVLCSHTPFFYWILASRLHFADQKGGAPREHCCSLKFLHAYLVIFNVVGCALHISYLPWV